MPSKQNAKNKSTQCILLVNSNEELQSRKERHRRDVDEFIKSLEQIPTKVLPNGQPSFPSFAHGKRFNAFLRQKRIEDKYFGGEEALEAHGKYTRNVFVRYMKACRETDEAFEEQRTITQTKHAPIELKHEPCPGCL